MLICKTPLRISFFGGGTDFPAWYNKKKGLVLATSINKFTYIQARFLPEVFSYKFNYRLRYFRNEERRKFEDIKHPVYKAIINYLNLKKTSLEIIHNSDLPALSGMGSSSSNTVSTLNALSHLKKIKKSKLVLAKEAIFIEQKILNEFVGSQDQIITSFGGFNSIKFSSKNFSVKKIQNTDNIQALENSVFLVFTGMTRFAQKIEKQKIKKLYDKVNLYNQLYSIAKDGVSLMNSKKFNIKEFGNLLSESWETKKKLGKNISNIKINKMYVEAMNHGAYGGKLLGAGSGGFLLFICNKKVKNKLQKYFKYNYIIPIKFENEGSKIIYEN